MLDTIKLILILVVLLVFSGPIIAVLKVIGKIIVSIFGGIRKIFEKFQK